MPQARVQCLQCNYLTTASEKPCPRCGLSLVHARVVSQSGAGGTVFTGPDHGSESFAESFQARAETPKPLLSRRMRIFLVIGVLASTAFSFAVFYRVSENEKALFVREKYAALFRTQPNLTAKLFSRKFGQDFSCTYSRLGQRRLFDFMMERAKRPGASVAKPSRFTILFDAGQDMTVILHDRKAYRKRPRAVPESSTEFDSLSKYLKQEGFAEDSIAAGMLRGAVNDPFMSVAYLLESSSVTVTEEGPFQIGDYETILVLINDGKPEPIRAFYCPELGNAVVRLEVPAAFLATKSSIEYELSKIVLEVDPLLHEIPQQYSETFFWLMPVFPEPVVLDLKDYPVR